MTMQSVGSRSTLETPESNAPPFSFGGGPRLLAMWMENGWQDRFLQLERRLVLVNVRVEAIFRLLGEPIKSAWSARYGLFSERNLKSCQYKNDVCSSGFVSAKLQPSHEGDVMWTV